jgi:hypothetical protein
MRNNTNSAEFEIPTKVVNIQNPTKVGRIFFCFDILSNQKSSVKQFKTKKNGNNEVF